jgi:hypothetical protein
MSTLDMRKTGTQCGAERNQPFGDHGVSVVTLKAGTLSDENQIVVKLSPKQARRLGEALITIGYLASSSALELRGIGFRGGPDEKELVKGR